MNQPQASTQGPERQRSADPLEEAFRVLGQLEMGGAGLDANIALTSIAISLKRIANALDLIAGGLGRVSYDNQQLRNNVREGTGNIVAAIEKVTNAL